MTTPVPLGQVQATSGVVVILDPCYGEDWRHDDSELDDTGKVDLAIVGPDAEAAGR